MQVRLVETCVQDLGPGVRVAAWLGRGREAAPAELAAELAVIARKADSRRLSLVVPAGPVDAAELLELACLARPEFHDVCVYAGRDFDEVAGMLGQIAFERLRGAVDVWVLCPRLGVDACDAGARALGLPDTWQPSWFTPEAQAPYELAWRAIGGGLDCLSLG